MDPPHHCKDGRFVALLQLGNRYLGSAVQVPARVVGKEVEDRTNPHLLERIRPGPALLPVARCPHGAIGCTQDAYRRVSELGEGLQVATSLNAERSLNAEHVGIDRLAPMMHLGRDPGPSF